MIKFVLNAADCHLRSSAILGKILRLTGFVVAVVFGLSACGRPLSLASEALSSGSVLFQDDFSSPESGWRQGGDTNGVTGYFEDGFRIYVGAKKAAKVTVPGLDFKDTIIEVDVEKHAGPDDNLFGVVCRYQDEANFYFFEVSSDGYYGIGKYAEGQWQLLGMDQMQTTDAIHQGTQRNHLRVECVQDRLGLYVNGNKLVEIQDTSYPVGDVGLLAGTLTTEGTDVIFDNFSVLKP